MIATTLLTNGRYAVHLTDAGTGYSTWNGWLLTRWGADATEDADGLFVYLYDLERGTPWSLGHQPVQAPASRHAAGRGPER